MPEPLRHATLRQLQIFLAAAQSSSFARAAETLHLTQPAVSMQMGQLADSLGIALFEKRGRNLVLTRAGQTLVPYVERIARTLREAGEAIDALQGLRHGSLRIALVTTTSYFAPRLVAQFRAQHPQIELDVSIADRERVISWKATTSTSRSWSGSFCTWRTRRSARRRRRSSSSSTRRRRPR